MNANNIRDLFKKVKLIIRKFKAKTLVVEDKNGNQICERGRVLDRWREYCEELCKENTKSTNTKQMSPREDEIEPGILKAEVKRAVQYLIANKAPGSDEITAGLLKALRNKGS